jgi:Zinc knuckle
MADLWSPHKLKNIEEEPNKSESKKNSLFRRTPIEQDKLELSAFFYAERNPADQAQPHPYQSSIFGDYQSPVTFDIKPDPIGPIMMSILMAQTQVVADKAKEYGMNKLTPFTGDWTKIRWFFQDCLGYLDMNQNIYNTNRFKVGFILSYMNNGKAVNWKEYCLDTLEDPTTGMPKFFTLVMFLADIQKVFWADDWVWDTVNRLETLRQGKKTAEELNTEFLQIVRQAGMDRKTPSGHLHLIWYYRKAMEPRLSWNFFFSNDVPKTINKWMETAIQFDMNWRMDSLFFNQDMKANSSKKADTNKSNENAHWWRTNEKKDPNAMDVDALTMEERRMLLRQGKCFRCKKTGHIAKDCPPEQGKSSKQKKVDPARFAYTTIKALIKEQRESLQRRTRMRRIFEAENWIDVSVSFFIYWTCTSSPD